MQARKSLNRRLLGLAIMLLAGSSLVWVSGCHSKTAPTNDNYIAALNTYYAGHDECLFPGGLRLPYQASEKGKDTEGAIISPKGLEALKDAGMLDRTEDKELKVYRYSLSAAGGRATSAFCYGHRVLTSIESASQPTKVNGFPETQVVYRYKLIDVPIWAKSDAIQAAFPALGSAVRGEGTGKSRLSQTMAGWEVPE